MSGTRDTDELKAKAVRQVLERGHPDGSARSWPTGHCQGECGVITKYFSNQPEPGLDHPVAREFSSVVLGERLEGHHRGVFASSSRGRRGAHA